MASPRIHPTAVIEKGAEIDGSAEVGPYAVIGPRVRIGPRTRVGPHAVIEGDTQIGEAKVDGQLASEAELMAMIADRKG